ncbi:uncharacterized protein LOC7465513 isoform X1 [Populus trichocarpa]|uniref:uncharacterized protein LOC7465513 isoform X1 n=1 Tax=Populus trichocarpa TaxID=3694 RepID=UPI000D188B2E|nr:uncharacterized protein LOC7465513 isoform X1 [Populus trichocarpa]|eukprot:XP_024452090.1 uncharacterized protein LOC7465513 isoform X1 [Populus trichocarpa]
MVTLTNKSLMYFEDLTLPTVQVIVMTASMRCSRCRQRVSQVISRMSAGLKEYTVDVHNKQVIMKGDTGKQWKKEDDHSNDEMNNERCQRLKLFLRSFVATCFGNYMAN